MQTPEIPRYNVVVRDATTIVVPSPDGFWRKSEDVDAAFAALPTGILTDDDIDRIRRAVAEGSSAAASSAALVAR